MKIVMTTLFGIEAITADELVGLGYDRTQIAVQDGVVKLDAGEDNTAIARAVARTNIFLATAERVLVQLTEFEAATFDDLFDRTRQLPWEDWIPAGAVFTIKGYSRKSALFGIPACQRLIKKAIVGRLLQIQGMSADATLPEDEGNGLVRIQFGIVNNQVSLMVDTSGDGLHKRGYRPLQHEAPIKETLAAAMLRLVHFRSGFAEALVDPCCGSGTLLIEAAMMAAKLAPGMNRNFAAEKWPFIGREPFEQARDEALAAVSPGTDEKIQIFGSDISPHAVEITLANARRAGVSNLITLRQADLFQLEANELKAWTGYDRQLIICNPPYGERLLDLEQAETIIRRLGQLCLGNGSIKSQFRLAVISPQDHFERIIGGKADKRRKLYNGMIRCTFFQYFRHVRSQI